MDKRFLIGLIVLIAVAAVFLWLYQSRGGVATIETETLDEEEAYEEFLNSDPEALMRNLEGADKQHLYSIRGKVSAIEGRVIRFEIENFMIRDDKKFVVYEEMEGEITQDTSIEKFVSTEGSVDLVLIPAKTSDIKIGSELEFYSYQNIFGIDRFIIEKLYIL
jgi:hypothetical protein